ncbi:con-Ins T1-like isoform X2 [Actinia tenebrosa]|uniref:Con-Ins T1-like isoform X2 n=1 Tax=Actinia tenebrosa TaxID=6105 RepID=A0A6P8IF09_ACTTE|nr:con-Ins T1-like isoform X2 [Actinia tenebrosa]
MNQKMRKPYALLLLLLMAVLVCSSSAYTYYKVNEVGKSRTDGFFCGDRIITIYEALCLKRRVRRSPILSGADAKTFIQKRSATYGQYHIVEECCSESCAYEEVREYC